MRGGILKPQWKYIPPPWDMDKPLSLGAPPAGAIRTEMRTPKETIQLVGRPRVRVPENVSVDLGVVDIHITNFGRNIEFAGSGLETDVGKRIVGPEKGMSIPEAEPLPARLRRYEERELGIEEGRVPAVRRNGRLISEDAIPELLEVFR